mgnify:CR=1 FL=1
MYHAITVRGKASEWSVPISDQQAEAMREDGIEVLEVHNSMPAWVFEAGMAGPWCFFQDLYDLPSRFMRWLRGRR